MKLKNSSFVRNSHEPQVLTHGKGKPRKLGACKHSTLFAMQGIEARMPLQSKLVFASTLFLQVDAVPLTG